MRVTFIGGFKDGEVSDIPSVEPRVEFREIEPPRVIDLVPGREYDKFPTLKTVSNWYILEHIVSHEEKFWFYIEESIGREKWVQRLVDGYHPIREEEG